MGYLAWPLGALKLYNGGTTALIKLNAVNIPNGSQTLDDWQGTLVKVITVRFNYNQVGLNKTVLIETSLQ